MENAMEDGKWKKRLKMWQKEQNETNDWKWDKKKEKLGKRLKMR